MWDVLLLLIQLAHLVLFVFIIVTPFLNISYLGMLHIIIIPSILLHWVLNNNICSLTIMEKFVRQKISNKPLENEECFTCRLIGPVYDFKKNNEQYTKFLYISMIVLWSINIYRLCGRAKNNFNELYNVFLNKS